MLVATHVGFISLGLGAIVRAVRAPGRATIDAALFFGLVACISAVTILYGNGAIENPVVDDVRQALRLALPLALLRARRLHPTAPRCLDPLHGRVGGRCRARDRWATSRSHSTDPR